MFYSYNYFRMHNDNKEILDYKTFYRHFSNNMEFGGGYTNFDHLKKNRFTNSLGYMNNIILRQEPESIIDIGCGDGINLPLSRLFPNLQYTGLDYAEKTIETAKRDYPNVQFKVGDAFSLPYEDDSFDMAIMSSLLILYKNIDDRVTLLSEAYRVLKPGGVLVINVWNDTFMIRNTVRLSRIIGRIKGDSLPQDFMAVHFSYKDVKQMINKTSFKMEERIQIAQEWGLLECVRYILLRKYHRDLGKEQTKGTRLPQNIREDLLSAAGINNTIKGRLVWGLFNLNRNAFSWMNLYIVRK